jgi:uncharacterized membrane protein
MLNKITLLFVCTGLMLALQNCGSKKSTSKTTTTIKINTEVKTADVKHLTAVSFKKEVMPILVAKCSPCHIAKDNADGSFDNIAAVKREIKGIIYRVGLPAENPKYMPLESKQPALTKAEIALLQSWKDAGMAE